MFINVTSCPFRKWKWIISIYIALLRQRRGSPSVYVKFHSFSPCWCANHIILTKVSLCLFSIDLLVKCGSKVSHSIDLEALRQARLYFLCGNRCYVNTKYHHRALAALILWGFIHYRKEQRPILFSLILRFLNRTVPKLYFEVGKVEFCQSSSQLLL